MSKVYSYHSAYLSPLSSQYRQLSFETYEPDEHFEFDDDEYDEELDYELDMDEWVE